METENDLGSTGQGSRHTEEDDVWGAADALLAEGSGPTIERVPKDRARFSRHREPLLERWFASLAARLAGGTDPSASPPRA